MVVPPKTALSRVRSRRTHPSSQAQSPSTYRARTPDSRGTDATNRCSSTPEGKVSTTKKTKHVSVYNSQPVREDRTERRPPRRPSRPKTSTPEFAAHKGRSERRLPSVDCNSGKGDLKSIWILVTFLDRQAHRPQWYTGSVDLVQQFNQFA